MANSSKPTVLIVDPILARCKRVQEELGDSADVVAAASLKHARKAVQGKLPFLIVVSLHQGSEHGLFVGQELRRTVGAECLITVYGRPAGQKVSQRGREKAAKMYKIDSFVPADLRGEDITAIAWAHLKEAARAAAALNSGQEPDDTSLHGSRGWRAILGAKTTRDQLTGVDGAELEPVGVIDVLKGPATAENFKRLMTAEIVKGRDLPVEGELTFGDILQMRVSAKNLKRLVSGDDTD
ncbi:MAG: hypothetical protein GY913_31140 [Proteobacteria bacterium]|nr:hypothetical protein [Pseudomonadota bacterium]MCP4921374.1 hypothetical protein [Pseudomonadota bacterium]